MLLERNDIFSYYEILGELGRGGMAVVYHARDTRKNREVALKILHAHVVDEQSLKRFRREAMVIYRLKHPNIVPLTDYGQHDGQTYLAMRFMTGNSLATSFRKPRRIVAKSTMHLLEQIASALDYAHSKGIVHRDLKLQNILLDEKQNAFLADFGIARIADTTRLTQTGQVAGTPMYMSPEQARGLTVDFRSDIYSFGVMTYLMVTGYYPFTAEDTLAILHKHVSEIPPNPTEVNPALPSAVDIVIQRALMKDPADRYDTAKQFVSALNDALITPETINTRTMIDVKALNPVPSVPIGNTPTSSRTVMAPTDDEHTQLVSTPVNPSGNNNRLLVIGVGMLAFIVIILGLVLALSQNNNDNATALALAETQVREAFNAELTQTQDGFVVEQTQTAEQIPQASDRATLPPTWTPTPTPTITPSPQFEFDPFNNIPHVIADGFETIPMFLYPDMTSELMAEIPNEMPLELTGRNAGSTWLEVISNDMDVGGWVRLEDVSLVDADVLEDTPIKWDEAFFEEDPLPPDFIEDDDGLAFINEAGDLFTEPSYDCERLIGAAPWNYEMILLERTANFEWVYGHIERIDESGWIESYRLNFTFPIEELPSAGTYGQGDWLC